MKCNWTSAQGHQISTNLRKTLHSETQTFKETKQQKQSVLQGCQTDRKFIKSKTTKFDPDACKWGWSDDAMNFFGNLQVSTHNKHRQITFQKDVQNLHCKL